MIALNLKRAALIAASQIDKLADCRMSYFLKYGLRVQERKEASVDPAEFGTYVHAVLENTARSTSGFPDAKSKKVLFTLPSGLSNVKCR